MIPFALSSLNVYREIDVLYSNLVLITVGAMYNVHFPICTDSESYVCNRGPSFPRSVPIRNFQTSSSAFALSYLTRKQVLFLFSSYAADVLTN
jgi:hypothetical protein